MRLPFTRIAAEFCEPFRAPAGYRAALIAVFVLINGLILYNAYMHHSKVGYDSGCHLNYVRAFTGLHLVTPEESEEFYSPPLPYVIPALFDRITGMRLNLFWPGKVGQLVNALLSCGLTWYLLKACRLISPRPSLRLGALAFLGLLPVYYKTFAFVRGEPYVAFFAVAVLYYVILLFIRRRFSTGSALLLGGALGLCALSRQWGIFLFPAVGLFGAFQWICCPGDRRGIAKALCLSLLLGSLIGGWFYVAQRCRYGSTTAFNRKPMPTFAFSNQPASFYFGLGLDKLFTNPLYPSFANQFLPTFYSELWGDYEGYFVVWAKDLRQSRGFIQCLGGEGNIVPVGPTPPWMETNVHSIRGYLGRVNAVSLFPSALALIAVVWAGMIAFRPTGDRLQERRQSDCIRFLLMAIAISAMGYLWFLVMFPSIGKGDTIKASYMLHLYPLLAVIVGLFLCRMERYSRKLYYSVWAVLLLVFVHNVPVMITHYPICRYYNTPIPSDAQSDVVHKTVNLICGE
jgi:hypothetical protein